MRKVLGLAAVAGLLSLLGGCDLARSSSGASTPRNVAARAAAPAVTLRVADERDLAAVVARQRGKVVLVDCWATWCVPCVAQFPHTVALERQDAARGLVVVSLSFNEPDEEAAVLKFLRARHATFDNLLSRHGAAQQAFDAFDIKNGALPYYMLFDRRGRLRNELGSGGADHPLKPADIDQAVEKLLAEQ